jgi:hypothetical protein
MYKLIKKIFKIRVLALLNCKTYMQPNCAPWFYILYIVHCVFGFFFCSSGVRTQDLTLSSQAILLLELHSWSIRPYILTHIAWLMALVALILVALLIDSVDQFFMFFMLI